MYFILESQKLWSKDYVFLLISVLFASLCNGALIVIFPVYVIDLGGNNALTGLMMTGMTVAGIVTRLAFGPLIDSWGRKKVLVLGTILFAINALLYCFITDLAGLFVLRIFNGISQGVFFPVPPTVASDLSPKDKLVQGMSYFGIPPAIGAGLGPVLGMWVYEDFGALPLFVCLTLLAVLSYVFAIFIKERYQVPEKKAPREKREWKRPKLSSILEFSVLLPSIILLFISLGQSSTSNFLAPFGLERGIADISIFFLLNNIVIILTRLFTDTLTKKFGEVRVITVGGVLFAAATVIIAFSYSMVPIVISSLLFGVGVSLITQLLQVLMFRMVPENRRGVANSTYMLLGDIGMGLGATIWGVTSAYGGYTITYILSAVVIVVAIFLHLAFLAPRLGKQRED